MMINISRCRPLLRPFLPAYSLRSLITASTPPPLNISTERPETMVLVESSLYKQSWKEEFTAFYPSRGLHFACFDITTTNDGADATLESMEQTLSRDLSDLSESAYTILIARGPIQSLVAQYYLESLPLAGLVLVDPLILPDDGRGTNVNKRWSDSIHTLLNSLEISSICDRATIGTQQYATIKSPLTTSNKTQTPDSELNLLQSLPLITNPRHLQLEPSSVPILVLYSSHHTYQDHYRNCAEFTARFHSCESESVDVYKIPVNNDDCGVMEDDLDWVAERVFEWYDEFVA